MSEIKTLLQINVTANWGSTGKIAEDIGKMALTKGWRSIIVYGRNHKASESELIRIGNDYSVKEHAFESRLFDNCGLSSRNATRKLIKHIAAISPDIIHLHNIHGYYINYKILFDYLTKSNTPVLWTLHDCWAFTGHCAYFDYAKCKKWMDGCLSPCPCKKFFPKSLLFERSEKNWALKRKCFTSNKNLTLVPVSEWLGKLVKQSFLKDIPMKVIHNGIDINIFSPQIDADMLRARYRLENKKILLGVASVWDERKGLDDYLKLAELLPNGIVIVLIGLHEGIIKHMPCNIIGLQRTESQRELAMWYTLADIVLNLSYEESFGLTTVEGFACGTPGVVYNKTASPELITSETGEIVPPGDVQGIRNSITTILNRGKSFYATACRQRAVELYNNNVCFERYFNLYETLIS